MTDTSTAAPRRNNWLIASAALNLFLLGSIASALLHGPPRHFAPGAGHGLPPSFERLADGLSPAGRETLRRLHADDDTTMAAQLATLRAARDGIDRAFAAEPFDRVAFDAAFAALREAEAAMSARMNHHIAALALALSPADRAAFAASMRRLPIGPPGLPPDGLPTEAPGR